MTKTALIIVDVQNDFIEGGSLAVEGGKQVAADIASLIEDHDYDLVVTTYDWHQPHGPEHFAAEGTDPDYNDTWPAHCVAGEYGSHVAPELIPALDAIEFTKVFKGQDTAAFSGFEGHENKDGSGRSLTLILDDEEIDQVDIVGLARDYCVKATCLDAASGGFTVRLLNDFTASVNPDNDEDVLAELEDAGVVIA